MFCGENCMDNKIKVLVVDDSALMRKLLSKILESDPAIEVIGTAPDGAFALKKIAGLKPDVVTLDVEMSGMDGITALQHIMHDHPLPVVIISSLTQEGAETTVECLELGAIDFVPKPSGTISLDIERQAQKIISKVKDAALVNPAKLKVRKSIRTIHLLAQEETWPLPEPDTKLGKAVVIGISTGGPQSLIDMLPLLPADFPAPVFLVQHMPSGFTKSFADRLNSICRIKVEEAKSGEVVQSGKVYVAPGGIHLSVAKRGLGEGAITHISSEPGNASNKPSVDVMMISAAKLYGKNTVGVIMTGMGNDGTAGMKMIKSKGGRTIAQDENSSVIFGMPNSAIQANCVDTIRPLHEIPSAIMQALEYKNKRITELS